MLVKKYNVLQMQSTGALKFKTVCSDFNVLVVRNTQGEQLLI